MEAVIIATYGKLVRLESLTYGGVVDSCRHHCDERSRSYMSKPTMVFAS